MGPQRLQNVLGHRTYLHQTVDSVMHSQYDFMYDWALEHLISLLSLLIVECGGAVGLQSNGIESKSES